MGGSKDEGDLDRLVLYTLEGSADVYRELAQLFDRLVVDEVDLFVLATVEYDSHHCLTGSHGTVCFCMDLVNRDGLPFSHKRVKHVFAEVLPLDHNFLLFRVFRGVEGSEGIDAIGHFGDSGGDGSGVEAEHAGSSDHTHLGSSGNQHNDVAVLESLFHDCFQKGALREASYHEDEVYSGRVFVLGCFDQFFDFVSDFRKKFDEKSLHDLRRQVNRRSSSLFDLSFLFFICCVPSIDQLFQSFG